MCSKIDCCYCVSGLAILRFVYMILLIMIKLHVFNYESQGIVLQPRIRVYDLNQWFPDFFVRGTLQDILSGQGSPARTAK